VSAIWDGDTGHVTITATTSAGPVNLVGATVTVITRNVEAPYAVLVLDVIEASSDRENGIIVANGEPLDVGTYDLVERAEAGGIITTYPSPDKGPETLVVYAKLDAA
jgi:hypothetical protein